ncbi:hypothetical protein EDB87DRAFT_1689122 [Lactarius vividus]|nr:hypothetical protein EDB87DRAFT_1689122 [Lactarius vividus]
MHPIISPHQLAVFSLQDPCTITINEVLSELKIPQLFTKVARLQQCLRDKIALDAQQANLQRLENEAISIHSMDTSTAVTSDPPERATTPPCNPEDSPPAQFVAWSPTRDPLDTEAQAAEEAEARERLWKFHQSRTLHLRAAILATWYIVPQDPPQSPED